MKNYKGKAIYQPNGKAAEYAKWACNFYVGCSNDCTYCYCKKGILAPVMGQDKPQLKKCFKDEAHALEVFEKELKFNLPELQKHGLFFSFTTDPMIEETIWLTLRAIDIAENNTVPINILTKSATWIDTYIKQVGNFENEETCTHEWRKNIAFGFTLTGHDELEPNASTNTERIEAMQKLHHAGFKTFASIEPIIELYSSCKMIQETNGFCDLYKIGLESGKKYNQYEIQLFIESVIKQVEFFGSKIYFKDSLLKQAGIERSELPDNCVTRDYSLFNTPNP